MTIFKRTMLRKYVTRNTIRAKYGKQSIDDVIVVPNFYRKTKDGFYNYLLNQCDDKISLQPEKKHILAAQQYFKNKVPQLPAWLPMMDKIVKSHSNDLDRRCEIIKTIINRNTNIKFIITMDGHGRLVGRLLNACPNVRILVYDIEAEAHEWHEMVFPTDRTISYNKNVFDAIYEAIETGLIEYTVIYLNFCGIGQQTDAVLKCMEAIRAYDNQHDTQCIKQFVVSFSNCRKTHLSDNLKQKIQEMYPAFILQTLRKDFITMSHA
jgi:hypothetical protein